MHPKQTASSRGPFISLHRANAVGVLLARLKLTAEQAEHAVLSLLHEDVGHEDVRGHRKPGLKLDEDAIASLLQCLPTRVRSISCLVINPLMQ